MTFLNRKEREVREGSCIACFLGDRVVWIGGAR